MAQSQHVRYLRMEVHHGQIAVELIGRGPSILFLHGLTANRSSWTAVARRLPPTRTLVLPDLAGRGTSTPDPRARYRLTDELVRVERLLAALELERPLVVGHSQGAALGLCLALGPARVRGLVLVNPVTPWTPRPAGLGLLRFSAGRRVGAPVCRRLRRRITSHVLRRRVFSDPRRPTAALVERYAAPYADSARSAALMRVLADWSPGETDTRVRRLAGDLDLPVAILAGARDRRIAAADVRRLAARLGAPLWSDRWSGHALPEENPAMVARAILRVDREAATVEVDRLDPRASSGSERVRVAAVGE